MAVSPDYRDAIEDRLRAAVPALKTRKMFGGLGIYSGSYFFALADDDVLYFKVNDSNRPDFEAAGVGPFRPFPDNPDYVMQYYEVPARVIEDSAQLREWAARAIAVARSKPRRKPPRKKKA